MTWCGQCFATLPTPPEDASLQVRLRPHAPPIRDVVPPAVYSRWRRSDTSFGPVGRALLTLGLTLALIAGEPMLRGFIVISVGFDVPSAGFLIFYVVAVAVPAGLYLTTRIWRRVRVA
jgi:hypothetical protein